MAKKSITPSFRLNEDDYLKFKELKEKYNLSWTKFIEYSNKLIENDMKKMGDKS
nr:MAG TPA: NikA, BACTERIAL CONJUGATION, RELAXASE, DNA [Caudoviricetes sp.]